MRDLEKVTHRDILEKILKEKGIAKTTFAIQLGFTTSNYTRTMNADYYTEKFIKKVCAELDIPTSVFDLRNAAPFQINQHNGMVSQNITGDLYERLLEEKQARIESLERQLAKAEDVIQELKLKLK